MELYNRNFHGQRIQIFIKKKEEDYCSFKYSTSIPFLWTKVFSKWFPFNNIKLGLSMYFTIDTEQDRSKNILMNYDFVYCTFSGDLNGDLLAAISEGGSGAGPLTGDVVFLGLSGGRGAEPLLGFQTFVTDFSSFLFIFYRLISLRNN